jgi:hypothetical protein
MERRVKVELFEKIRREYEFVIGTVKGVTRKLGVHRRRPWPTPSRQSAS